MEWLNGKFPLSIQTVRDMLIDRCDLPDGFDVSEYEMFQGTPTKVLSGGYSFLIISIVFPPIPKFLSGSSVMVVVKNSCGIFIIFAETSVTRFISNVFCSSDNFPHSILI